MSIPKVIHYCWFGNNPKPAKIKKCIKSWEKYMPEYKIVEWNESNFDINICTYVKEAYNAKKWAFVSDYARYYILYNFGGIYLDTDVEIIKPLDEIVFKGSFMAREPRDIGGMINPGLILGAPPKDPFYKEILEEYNNDTFVKEDGELNLKTIVQRTTELFEKYGFNLENEDIQCVRDIYIYPSEYFCPIGWNGKGEITKNTYSVHLYLASWLPKKEQKFIQINIALHSKKIHVRLCAKIMMLFMKIDAKIRR